MILCFELSMPNRNSWNGKWSGENDFYAKVVNFGKGKKRNDRAKEVLDKRYFYYSFGDGWAASVSVKKIESKESSKIRRKSKGFCGYDWMIDSIVSNLEIIPLSQRSSRNGTMA